MIQWHFSNDKLLAPLFLVFGAASPGKDNGPEPVSIMLNKV